jgi:hypothetical protein
LAPAPACAAPFLPHLRHVRLQRRNFDGTGWPSLSPGIRGPNRREKWERLLLHHFPSQRALTRRGRGASAAQTSERSKSWRTRGNRKEAGILSDSAVERARKRLRREPHKLLKTNGEEKTQLNMMKIKELLRCTGHPRATSGSSGISTIGARGVRWLAQSILAPPRRAVLLPLSSLGDHRSP